MISAADRNAVKLHELLINIYVFNFTSDKLSLLLNNIMNIDICSCCMHTLHYAASGYTD